MVDLDVVVEVADEPERDHRPDGQVAGAGEADLGPDVPDGVADDDRTDDGDAAHGRRARLGDVGRRAVLPDVLADLAAPEVADQKGGGRGSRSTARRSPRRAGRARAQAPASCRQARTLGYPTCVGSEPNRGRERVPRLDRVVEGEPFSGDLLVRLVALARDDDDVARDGRYREPGGWRRGGRARPRSVGVDACADGDARQHLLDDRRRVLVPRIVRREERQIAQALRRPAPSDGRLARSRLPPHPKTQSTRRPPRRASRASPSTTPSRPGCGRSRRGR